MSGNSQIVIFGLAGAEPRNLMQKLTGAGYSCVFQGVNSKVLDRFGLRPGGSSTAAAIVIDLGNSSTESAVSMLESSPQLKGKIFVLGPDGGKAVEGLIFTTPATLIDDLKRLV